MRAARTISPETKRLIRRLKRDGYNGPEIAGILGLDPRRVRTIASRIGANLPRGMGGNARLVCVPVSARCMPLARELAAAAGVGLGEFLARAIRVDLEGGGRDLVRRMGPLARLPRRYTRRRAP